MPLVTYLYVIYVESLIRVVMENDRLSGITMPDLTSPVKALAYADSILVVFHHSQMASLFSLTAQFTEATGSVINVDKTNVLAWPASRQKLDPNWVVDQLKVCGIYSCLWPMTDSAYNWDKIFRRPKEKLPSLAERKQSITGKIIMINAVTFPMFHHIAAVSSI